MHEFLVARVAEAQRVALSAISNSLALRNFHHLFLERVANFQPNLAYPRR
jgi:hypothetical protein